MTWSIGLAIGRNARSHGYFVRECVALLGKDYLRTCGMTLASNRLVFSASSFLATSHFMASHLTVFGSVQDWLIEGREVLET